MQFKALYFKPWFTERYSATSTVHRQPVVSKSKPIGMLRQVTHCYSNIHTCMRNTVVLRIQVWGLGGVVGLTLPMARADRGSRPVYYLPCSDLGQVVNLSLSVA